MTPNDVKTDLVAKDFGIGLKGGRAEGIVPSVS